MRKWTILILGAVKKITVIPVDRTEIARQMQNAKGLKLFDAIFKPLPSARIVQLY